jgi:hypothetical protein
VVLAARHYSLSSRKIPSTHNRSRPINKMTSGGTVAT